MRALVRIYGFVRPYKGMSLGAILLLLGMVGADLLIPRLTQRIIDEGIARGDLQVVLWTSLLMMGLAFVSTLFALVNTFLSVRVSQRVAADLRSALFRKTQTFSFASLDRFKTGQLMVRTVSDVNLVETVVAMSLRILTRAPIWAVGSMVLLVLTSRSLAWILVGAVPVIVGLVVVFFGRGRAMFMAIQRQLDRLNNVLQENLAGVRVVKAFVREDREQGRFGAENEAYMAKNIRVMTFFALLGPTLTLLVNLGVIGVLWFGGRGVAGGTMTVGQVVASINYVTYALFPLLLVAGMLGMVSAAEASAARILEVLDLAPDVEDRPSRPHVPHASPLGLEVTFEDVHFSYDRDGGEPVLQGINLRIEPGQTVAILGATGSGKSTLIHLIPRFYEPTRGRIRVDGVDVRELPLDELRRQVGVVLQESVLFTGTVRDNIRYGRPGASDEEVVEAAKAAQAQEFIVELPQGYDTIVGERGVNLSGGQRQRIAIARALVVRPRLLILDDSTSSVDIETELKLQEALDRLLAEKAASTRIVVAQRISTVLRADKIVVLERGRIVAMGTHGELLGTSPLYREIYQSQLGEAVHV